jgi:hypothetical protein
MDFDCTDGCWMRRCRKIHTNAGLCGPVVPLSSGAAYVDGISGTALGSNCPEPLENHSAYQACIASPSTCTALCVPQSPTRMRVARAQLSSHEAAVAVSV